MKNKLTRKSFFIDEAELRRARLALGVDTDADAVRGALREVARMKALARFMERSEESLPRGSFDRA
jgi:Arc/MetJ family transcription regulator